jgi:hypothetical protein
MSRINPSPGNIPEVALQLKAAKDALHERAIFWAIGAVVLPAVLVYLDHPRLAVAGCSIATVAACHLFATRNRVDRALRQLLKDYSCQG